MSMFTFVRTCYACPEQYDVFDEDENQIAYLRLRHSNFTVKCPDVGGELVYQAYIDEPDVGIFTDKERDEYLEKAARAISKYMSLPFTPYKVVDEWVEDQYGGFSDE